MKYPLRAFHTVGKMAQWSSELEPYVGLRVKEEMCNAVPGMTVVVMPLGLVLVQEDRMAASKLISGRSWMQSYVLAKGFENLLAADAGKGSRKQRLVPECAFSCFPVAASQPSLKRPPPALSCPLLTWKHAQGRSLGAGEKSLECVLVSA